MVGVLMKSAELITLGQPHPQDALGIKMTLGLLKIKAFQNKGYDVIIPVHDVTKNFITWLKLECRSGHMTKVC